MNSKTEQKMALFQLWINILSFLLEAPNWSQDGGITCSKCEQPEYKLEDWLKTMETDEETVFIEETMEQSSEEGSVFDEATNEDFS